MTELDLYAAAENPQSASDLKTYFGEISLTLDFYVLKKGEQKRLFNPATDPQSSARLLVDLRIIPFDADYEIKQEVFNFSTEWRDHTLPSLQKLTANLRSLNGKFCQIKKVQTGETYKSKDKLDAQGGILEPGAIKNKTAVVFVAIYDDRDLCIAARDAFFGTTTTVTGNVVRTDAVIDLSDPLRVQAAGMLETLWTVAKKDISVFMTLIESTPAMAKYFNADSPEVIAFTEKLPF